METHNAPNPLIRFFYLFPLDLFAILFFIWTAAHYLFGDRWGWLFLLNTFAIYLIVPLPLWWLRPLVSNQKRDGIIALVMTLFSVIHFGQLLLPKSMPTRQSETLTIVSSNLLGSNNNIDGIEAALRATQADVIAIQELNVSQAEMLQTHLVNDYPYQYLDPQPGVRGMGIISRIPITPQPVPWPDESWVGKPQIVEFKVAETAVQLINFHAIPPIGAPLPDPWAIQIRERQARLMADYARTIGKPVLLAGDLNATDQSRAHAILDADLQDAWRIAGWGFGNSWPGVDIMLFNRISIPNWLVRIDHIFVSADWQILSAAVGPWDGQADHRPVMAELQLTPQTQP